MRFVLSRTSSSVSTLPKTRPTLIPNRPLIEPLEARQLLSAALTGNVTGLVTDTSGNPLSDARVRLVPQTAGPAYSATTDSSGDYVVNNVLDGDYTVKVRDQGYIPNASLPELLDVTLVGADNPAPTVQLTPIASGTVSGQVTDSNGNPVADASVRLVLSNYVPPAMAAELHASSEAAFAAGALQTGFIDAGGYGITATTDANGDYIINDVLVDSYYVRARDTGFTANTSASFTVAAGSNTAPTVQLFAITHGTVTGQITDASGNPLSGAGVVLEPATAAGPNIQSHYTAITNANGDYSIKNVLAGAYTVSGGKTGYTLNQSASFTVASGSNTAPTVALTELVYGKVTGQITDAQGNPLPNVQVTITNQSSSTSFTSTAKTDSNGDYTFKHVMTGSYKITTNDSGYLVATSAAFTVATGPNTAPTVELSPIQLGTITGEITDASGNPLKGATVYVLAAGTTFPPTPRDLGNGIVISVPESLVAAKTNSKGIYTLNNVPVGTYESNTPAASYELGVSDNNFIDNTSAAFTITAGSNTGPTVVLTGDVVVPIA
jgi:large repetitive protein